MIQRADQPFFFLLRLCPRQLYQSPYTVIFSESHGTPSARMHIRVRQAICQLNPSTGQGRAVNSGHSGQCIRSCQTKKRNVPQGHSVMSEKPTSPLPRLIVPGTPPRASRCRLLDLVWHERPTENRPVLLLSLTLTVSGKFWLCSSSLLSIGLRFSCEIRWNEHIACDLASRTRHMSMLVTRAIVFTVAGRP